MILSPAHAIQPGVWLAAFRGYFWDCITTPIHSTITDSNYFHFGATVNDRIIFSGLKILQGTV